MADSNIMKILEAVKYRVPESTYEKFMNALNEIQFHGSAKRNSVLEYYAEKYGIKIGEEVEYEDFKKIVEAIENDDTVISEFIDKIRETFDTTLEEAIILFLLYGSRGYMTADTLFMKFEDAFAHRVSMTASDVSDYLKALEARKLVVETVGGWALSDRARKKLDKLYRKKVTKKLLREAFIPYDVPEDPKLLMDGLKKFFSEYIDENGNIKYLQRLNQAVTESNSKLIPVDYTDIESVLPRVANELITNPDDVLHYMNEAMRIVLIDKFGVDDATKYSVGIRELPTSIMPREARKSNYVSKLVQIEGIVVRATEIKPYTKVAVYVCKHCGYRMDVPQNPFTVLEKPKKCEACGSNRIELSDSKSLFDDIQYIKLQDFPDRLRGGDVPQTVYVALIGSDLIERVKPGDKAKITGIVRIDKTRREKTPVMSVIVEALWAESENKDFYEIEITEEDEKKIKEFAKREDVIEVLRDSIAPKIYGYKMEKLGILLSLFGGVSKTIRGVNFRGDIHVLLFGEPGTAKTKLLYFAKSIAPRSVFVSCNGATKAGIGAAAVRDEQTGEWVLDAGAFVIADLGFVFMDELDKLSKDAKNILHEILENQEISVAKAGIVATLNTRATMIASANPKDGRFNRRKPIVEQINLPDTLLSRMDLIFVFVDEPDEEKDEKIALTILEDERYDVEEGKELLDPEFIMKYIAYARQNVKPVLSKEAIKKIKDYYVSLRKRAKLTDAALLGDAEYARIPITARQLEAIKRLTQAVARAKLKPVADEKDAELAIEVMEYSLKKLIVDEEGELDISILEVGKSAKKLSKIEIIREIINDLTKKHEDKPGAPHKEVIEEAKKHGIDELESEEIIEKLKSTGEVYMPRSGYYKIA